MGGSAGLQGRAERRAADSIPAFKTLAVVQNDLSGPTGESKQISPLRSSSKESVNRRESKAAGL